MALSIYQIAYGAVALAGVTLFLIRPPDERARPMESAAPARAATVAEAAPAPSVAAGGGMTLQSVSLKFPESDRTFPGGAVADAINNNCLACHSAGMVLTQPTLSKAAWTAEVEKMRASYKAPVDPKDIDAIVGYLAGIKPAK